MSRVVRGSWPVLAVLGLVLALVAACTPQPTAMAPPNPPPPPRAETIPKPPVTEDAVTWQPGHWEWDGKDYSWHEGAWVPLAGHGTQWQPGYWALQNGAWVWVPAHWM